MTKKIFLETLNWDHIEHEALIVQLCNQEKLTSENTWVV